MKLFETLLDGKVLTLLGISLFLFAFSALRQGRKDKARGDSVTSGQTAGFILWQALDRWVNYALYPIVVVQFGLLRGGLVMTVLTLFLNVGYIIANNATEEDWTFMSWVTYLRDSTSCVWPLRYCRMLKTLSIVTLRPCAVRLLSLVRSVFKLKAGRFELSSAIGFLYLTVWKDSFYAINFLFGKNADLRRGKVLFLFLVSHVVCNAVWTPIAGMMGELVKYVLNLISL